MSATLAELLGTMILILLGDGVVANVVLKRFIREVGAVSRFTRVWHQPPHLTFRFAALR